MARHVAAELIKDNVNVKGIAPGFFAGKMTKFLVADEKNKPVFILKTAA